MTKHIPHKSSSKVSRLMLSIVAALVILTLVMVLLARFSSTQNGTEVVVSVPTRDVAALEATSKPASVPSPDVAVIVSVTSTPRPVPEYIAPTEVSTPDYAEAFYATTVAIAQTLDTVTPIPGIPPEKQGLSEERMQRAVATALILFPVPTGYVPPMVTEPPWPPKPLMLPTPRSAGDGFMLEDIVGDSLSATMIWAVNGWYEEKNNTEILVLAGRTYKNVSPPQGQVYVAIYDLNARDPREKPIVYPSPSRHGELKITDVVGERLTLTAEDNTQFYFDVPTRIWGSP